MPTTLVWFRDDLRLTDNPALTWAAERGDVVGVVVDETTSRPLGRAATWWRDRSIAELSERVPLTRAAGDPREIIPKMASELGAEVVWNRRYHSTEIDAAVKDECGARSFPGFLLTEPWEMRTGSGTPYRVFTPFYKAAQAHLAAHPPAVLPAPALEGQVRIGVPRHLTGPSPSPNTTPPGNWRRSNVSTRFWTGWRTAPTTPTTT